MLSTPNMPKVFDIVSEYFEQQRCGAIRAKGLELFLARGWSEIRSCVYVLSFPQNQNPKLENATLTTLWFGL